jgi:hypothetical protein
MKSCKNKLVAHFGIGAWIAGAALLLSSGFSTYSGVAGAIDWPMPYTASAPHASNGRSVAISVVDKRPYVLSGDKNETFIGFIRSGFGVPYNTTFEPAEAVAEKVERDIIAEMSARGYEVGPEGRAMHVVILEFKHDGYENLWIFHEVDVTVYREGQKDTTTVKDKRSICGGLWSRCDDSRKAEELENYYGTMIRSIAATLESD